MEKKYSLEEIKELKSKLQEKQQALKADELYFKKEKARLQTKLKELGFENLTQAKDRLAKLETELQSLAKEIDEALKKAENPEQPKQQKKQEAIDIDDL